MSVLACCALQEEECCSTSEVEALQLPWCCEEPCELDQCIAGTFDSRDEFLAFAPGPCSTGRKEERGGTDVQAAAGTAPPTGGLGV